MIFLIVNPSKIPHEWMKNFKRSHKLGSDFIVLIDQKPFLEKFTIRNDMDYIIAKGYRSESGKIIRYELEASSQEFVDFVAILTAIVS